MPDLDAELSYFRIMLSQQFSELLSVGEPLPAGAIEEVVRASPFNLSPERADEAVRNLEASFTTRQTAGSSVRSEYRPWLQRRKSETNFFYWRRLNEFYMTGESLPPSVVSVLDNVTDEVLDYCGDPLDEKSWARRGMVMGHVQSGKTTNYSALICKAADVGYRIIILLAGITNSLRAQTQERLDETFIGKISAFNPVAQTLLPITRYGGNRFPAYGTSRDHDFSKVSASTYGVTIGALNEPIIFVTKKNKSTLGNLKEWLSDQTHGGLISEPLLLIDDEADNASINTSADPEKTTAINSAIREILSMFHRSSYVGYTATPFANIFIDPDTDDDMLEDDLFPRHFIKALDPPNNYVGAARVFADDGDLRSDMVRQISDYRDILPLKHKKDHDLQHLPPSLEEAVRVFLLTRAIRVLRGQGNSHCSMMINASRFNDVQEKLHGLVYGYLTEIVNSVEVNARLKFTEISDKNILDLAASFETEFADDGHRFDEILKVLVEALASVSVVTVNMRGGALDYSRYRDMGLHIIAIGGLALSRGLTLEGLTVSYILRNTAASDTLMQMARWFGYRPGFEKICRLYLPKVSLDHYEYVEEAIEELRAEIKRMGNLLLTPEDFGLKVRQSPSALRITAANKMRTASSLTLAQDYSGLHMEGHVLFNDQAVNQANLDEVEDFLSRQDAPASRPGVKFWEDVDGSDVLQLIDQFSFPPGHKHLGPITGKRSLFQDYVADRLNADLAKWDIAVPHPKQQQATGSIFGLTIPLRARRSGEFSDELWQPTGNRNRIADPDDARLLLSDTQIEQALLKGASLRGDKKFCRVRSKPMMLIHLFSDTGGDPASKFKGPVVSLSFCMPDTNVTPVSRSYQVNVVYRRQLELELEPDDDEETMQFDG
jgi:hypothetical protein